MTTQSRTGTGLLVIPEHPSLAAHQSRQSTVIRPASRQTHSRFLCLVVSFLPAALAHQEGNWTKHLEFHSLPLCFIIKRHCLGRGQSYLGSPEQFYHSCVSKWQEWAIGSKTVNLKRPNSKLVKSLAQKLSQTLYANELASITESIRS